MDERDALKQTDESAERSPEPPAVVVGIGASAGGLAALKTFFEGLEGDCGIAFVVVMHLSPEHESHLADLLQFQAKIRVQQVVETTPIIADHIYVIPPGYNLSAIDTHLRLSDLEDRRQARGPIDHFFRTLAATYDGNAIGVVLTGTGSDGTAGVREIKARGGLVVVQDPTEAEYDGMPQSAVATGMADLVMPVGEMAAAIQRMVRTAPRVPLSDDGFEAEPHQRFMLQKVFALLRARTGRDYSHYKRSTSLRRISRRMQLNFIENLSGYLDKLRDHPDEARALSDDLLITVTNFFRDSTVFQTLESEIMPRLFEGRQAEDSIRVWSAGCATGEEAYSLAMLLLEEAARRESAARIQIFATDLHEPSLAKARDGYYTADSVTEVSAERLRRFFDRQSEGYRIRKEVRDLIVFSQHNVLSDPPFSRLDLITCRNLLIYLQAKAQEDVIELFHYGLRPDGYLILGPSELVKANELFRPLDRTQKILQRRNVPVPLTRLPAFPWVRGGTVSAFGKVSPDEEPISYRAIHARMIEAHSPASVLISADDRVVYLSEQAGRYLVLPAGDPTQSVVKLVRAELRIELLSAVQAARTERRQIDTRLARVGFDGETRSIVMHVCPARDAAEDGFVLVRFEEIAPVHPGTPADGAASPDDDGRIRELESDLQLTRRRLQSVINQYETTQEEMRASNEELQSANEELRSTLEELETSKEELQSMNEELQTLNQENRHKVEELGLLFSDLQNLLTATESAALFLDREFRILRFTPKLGELFNVRMMDRGRPCSDITHRLAYTGLRADAEEVLDNLGSVEREVQDQAGRWYLMRVRPYRSVEERIEGVVVTFLDISARKEAEFALRDSDQRLAQEVEVLTRLHRTSLAVVGARDFAAAAQEILMAAIELLNADSGSVRIVRDGSERLEVVARHGFGPGDDALATLDAVGEAACAQALRMRRRVVVADVEREQAFADRSAQGINPPYRAMQATPLIDSAGNAMGVLSTSFRRARTLVERDERILDVLTPEASVVLERQRAEERLKKVMTMLEERVQERTLAIREKERQVRELAAQTVMAEQLERSRIAQVLHDDLQQLLFGVEIKLDLLGDEKDVADNPTVAARVAEVHGLVQRSITKTRQLALDLTPTVLEQQGLGGALSWLAGRMRELHGLAVDLQIPGNLAVPRQISLLLFNFVRELLFNVSKHAGVKEANVAVDQDDHQLVIRVDDHGRGFDPSALDQYGSYGMSHLRRHAALMNGDMHIDSAPGRGTRVILRLPVGGPQDSTAARG